MLLSEYDWKGGCIDRGVGNVKGNTRGCKPLPNEENMGVIHTQLNKLIDEVRELKRVTNTLKDGD